MSEEFLRPATKRMIDFAKVIARDLQLKEPDYSNFDVTSDFIGRYRWVLYEKNKRLRYT